MIFSQKHFDKVLKLNEEFTNASPSRRKEIEQEIIDMAPKDEFPASRELGEIDKLQEDLVSNLKSLAACGTKSDFETYVKELNAIDEKICLYAKRLGSELQKTDYGKLMANLLETKFGK